MGRPRKGVTVEDRLWSRLRITPDGCHEWTGTTNTPGGYGRIYHDGRNILTHRLVWVLKRGPIPEDMHVLHRCDNPPCCNVEHLFLGTNAENVLDKMTKGRFSNGRSSQTHCKNGHEFSPENTYIHPKGSRVCRTCKRDYQRARWHASKESAA